MTRTLNSATQVLLNNMAGMCDVSRELKIFGKLFKHLSGKLPKTPKIPEFAIRQEAIQPFP